jgi:hypothetical protein
VVAKWLRRRVGSNNWPRGQLTDQSTGAGAVRVRI